MHLSNFGLIINFRGYLPMIFFRKMVEMYRNFAEICKKIIIRSKK